jgi:site-specific recombinase XerD
VGEGVHSLEAAGRQLLTAVGATVYGVGHYRTQFNNYCKAAAEGRTPVHPVTKLKVAGLLRAHVSWGNKASSLKHVFSNRRSFYCYFFRRQVPRWALPPETRR